MYKDRVQRILQEMVDTTLFHETGFPTNNYRLTSVLYYKKRLISVGFNSTKTHPLQLQYGRNKDSCHLHAEVDCLIKAQKILDKDQFSKCTLYVARGARNKCWAMAMPCHGCQKLIRELNIPVVYYTISDSNYGTWHP